jgi:hypothetical protein
MLDQLEFSGKLWLSSGPGGWTFITLPQACADQIRFYTGEETGRVRGRSWGMIKVEASIGASSWETTIWPDKGSGSFLLPVKAAVRKKEGISVGDSADVKLRLLVPPGF